MSSVLTVIENYPAWTLIAATLVIASLRLAGLSKQAVTWLCAAILVAGSLYLARNYDATPKEHSTPTRGESSVRELPK